MMKNNEIKNMAKNAILLMEIVPVNVSGVVFSFANWMRYACDTGMSQRERNNHPITRAFVFALDSMIEAREINITETIRELEELTKEDE